MKKREIVLILIASGILGFFTSYYRHHKPLDKDIVQLGEDVRQVFHQPVTFVKQLKNAPDAGRKIFKEFCATCHAEQPVIDIRAPRIGDKVIWSALSKQGLPTLLKVTIVGRGAMPARGGCFECSDAQLTETIQYILQNSTQK